MIESTPGHPYSSKPSELLRVQANMEFRRSIAIKELRVPTLPFTIIFTDLPIFYLHFFSIKGK